MTAAANVLWTAGWDSTYRVADLVFTYRKPVRPHYVKDWRRASTRLEMLRQQEIREEIARIDPDAARLLLPTVVHHYDDIPADPAARKQHEGARQLGFLGTQYLFLTAMARSSGLTNLEIVAHRDDNAVRLLEGNVRFQDDDAGGYHELVPQPTKPALELFRPFRFPVFDMTKIEMGERAAAAGFGQVMELTWFCHYPTLGGKPCGVCNPCRYTREEGLGRRVPGATRARLVAHMVNRKTGAVARRIGHKIGRCT
ncbi:hypothetical protein FE251_11460 [Georgenia wutianyii]|uniref:7-cyano-7-deazaguanine synthase n=1 Tax=Georgenia wutianyii TaxID=2585135 RepID=A0ABX5VN41_9MICO|nr:7-cyano-7-deazaguanine synthase [Georgenia wutianyii]QDB79921.1 hypothetical protein FE251_11460 [Georgenia wutianyii]